MPKKKKVPTGQPEALNEKQAQGQRPNTNTREDISAQQTDKIRPNRGPEHKSRKKRT